MKNEGQLKRFNDSLQICQIENNYFMFAQLIS